MAYDYDFDDDSEVLKRLEEKFSDEPAQKPAAPAAEPAEGETPDPEPAEGREEGAETSEETLEEIAAEDDHVVTIGEGEKARKLSVKDLRSLAEREDAIKQRDTDTEVALKRATDEGDKALSMIQAVLGKATEEFSKFASLDAPGGWATARQKLGDEAFAVLQADYLAARNKVLFLQQEGNGFVAKIRENREHQRAEALKARDAALEKVEGITGGWTKAKADVTAYVKAAGMPADVIDTITNPTAIHMLWKAMMFDRGAAKAATSVKPVATSASKTTIKPGAKSTKDAATEKLKAARAALRDSGSLEAAEAVFAARFG